MIPSLNELAESGNDTGCIRNRILPKGEKQYVTKEVCPAKR